VDGVGRLHDQPGPPACRRCPQKGAPSGDELEDPARAQAGQALGRSRGGLTPKVHLAVDGRGLPLAVLVTPGNVNDSTAFDAVLNAVRVPRIGAGRPRRRPDAVIADKAYSSRAIRQALRRRGIRAVIPERTDQKAGRARRGRAGGRPPGFDRELYKARNVVERCFNRLEQFRAVATRFDKLAARYQAGLHLASLVLWLREPAQDRLSDRPSITLTARRPMTMGV
jgi:transposase